MSMNWEEFDKFSIEDKRLWIKHAGQALREKCEQEYLIKAGDLMLAGWTPDPVDHRNDMMSWKWRRPARRKNSKGMRFHSTDQAWNYLQRSTEP
jgi:hypothetical protein